MMSCLDCSLTGLRPSGFSSDSTFLACANSSGPGCKAPGHPPVGRLPPYTCIPLQLRPLETLHSIQTTEITISSTEPHHTGKLLSLIPFSLLTTQSLCSRQSDASQMSNRSKSYHCSKPSMAPSTELKSPLRLKNPQFLPRYIWLCVIWKQPSTASLDE